MAVGRVKTWIAGEVLTASDLNAEFNNILNNASDLANPLTKALDMNGFELILDANADTSITADTDDRIDLKLSGTDLFQFDGTTTTPINGINFVASATGVAVHQIAFGTDTNIDLELRSKGSGDVVLADDSGNEILVAADVASAVNEITVSNAVTTAPPFVQATGGDTNIDLELRSKGSGDVVLADDSGNEILVAADVASAVNEITVTNAVTTAGPILGSTGDDTNIDINITPKGSGATVLTAGALDEQKGSDIASAGTTDIGAGTGNQIDVTGTTTITGLGTVQAGVRREIEFDSALILTHNATSLILPGAANITTGAGDTATFNSLGSGNWRCHNYQRANGSSINGVVQIVNTQTGAVATGTTLIPSDDTIPQNTEGIEFMTLAITPTSTNNILEIEVVWNGSHSGTNQAITAGLFQDTTASALAVSALHGDTASEFGGITFVHSMTAGTGSSTTFKVRAGSNAAGTTTFNGAGGVRRYGGAIASSITIREIAA